MNSAKSFIFAAIVLFTVSSMGCQQLQSLADVANLTKCKFKIEGVDGFQISGIDISRIKNLNDVNLLDAGKLALQFSQKSLPSSFNLRLAIVNPTSNKRNATLLRLDGKLYINGTETVQVSNASQISIPANDTPVIVLLPVSLDMYKFFEGRSLQSLVDIAAGIGGANRNPANLMIKARPTVETLVGAVTYPEDITIVSAEFR